MFCPCSEIGSRLKGQAGRGQTPQSCALLSLLQHQGKHRCRRSSLVFSGVSLKAKWANDGTEWQQNRRDDCCSPAALNHSPSSTVELPHHLFPVNCRHLCFHLVTPGCRNTFYDCYLSPEKEFI